jgi:hypothetical protein
MSTGKYPECEKLSAVSKESNLIGAFLDWLINEKRVELMQWRPEGDNGEPYYIEHILDADGICNRCEDARHCCEQPIVRMVEWMNKHFHHPEGTKFYECSDNSPFHKKGDYVSESDSSASRVRNPNYESWHEGFIPVFAGIEKLLAEYYEIDLNKVEDERRAMLDDIRKQNKD